MSQVKEAIDTYMYVVSSLSPHTVISYQQRLKVFIEYCEKTAIQELSDITPKAYRGFIAHVSERINPRTGNKIVLRSINTFARILKIFLKWTTTYEDFAGCIKASTLGLLKPPKYEDKVKSTLTVEEINRLYTACKKEKTPELVSRDTAILSLLLDTGIRATELCTLTLDNVHLDPQDSFILVLGKGGKEREIGLGQKARIDLYKYIRRFRRNVKQDAPVFLTHYGLQMTRNGLDQMLYRLKDWGNVTTDGGAHMFRHTYATMYLEQGGDIYKLSRLMGHTSVSTTEIYVRGLKNKQARVGKSVLDSMK